MARTRSRGTVKRGRPRPKKSTGEGTARRGNAEPKATVTTAKRRRGRPSNANNKPALGRDSSAPDTSGKRQRRREATEVDELEIAEATAPSPKYLRLAPKRKRIPQEVIEKWPMISTPVLDQISVVLRRAKDAIVLSRRDPQKQQEADEVLNGVIRHLERHFANTKIPPQSKAHHFDLNHIAAYNERVYRELTTTRHRNQLLDEQIKIAAAKLKEEEQALDRMKENKQQWRRRWKSQEKKQLHPLLQESENLTIVEDKPEDIGLRKASSIDTTLFDAPDADLAPLLQRLRRNLETMQGNHAPLGGISEAVGDAHVALDDVVFQHAPGEQYDALMNY